MSHPLDDQGNCTVCGFKAEWTHSEGATTITVTYPFPPPPDAPSEAELIELDSEFQGSCTDESHVREGCVCP